jgi:hypothetical protein
MEKKKKKLVASLFKLDAPAKVNKFGAFYRNSLKFDGFGPH